MTSEDRRFVAVDQLLERLLGGADDVMAGVLAECASAGLPEHRVSLPQGRLLMLLVRMSGARRVLEVGTLGGYSTIWLARGMSPGGRLISIEKDGKHAAIARINLKRAGLDDVVGVREGDAMATLAALEHEGAGPFDLIFLDADKANLCAYFDWSMRLAKSGSVIVADNVIRDGAILESAAVDEHATGARRFLEMISVDRRVDATFMQTVGGKGWDGMAIAVVK